MEDVVSLSDYFKFLFALGIVIGLILLLALLLRRFGAVFPSAMAKGRRIGVVESIPLDAKHRLILLKRDDKEHLVLLGPTSNCVIETAITPLNDTKEFIEIEETNKSRRPSNSASQIFKDFLASTKSNKK